MELGIKGRTALVLGAGGGLGGAIANVLAGEGANLALADVNPQALSHAVERTRSLGAKAVGLQWDLAALESIEAHISKVEAELGPIDILVNNTGGPPPTSALGQETELWQAHFLGMVLPVVKIADRVVPGMRDRGWGRVVTSASSGVVSPIPNLAVSNALRMSLLGWSKTLAREVAADGVTVNVVVPGRIATGRTRFLDKSKAEREGRSLETIEAESTASIPAGRYGEPAEYAQAVAFLASNAASYITGSVLRIDGGLIASI